MSADVGSNTVSDMLLDVQARDTAADRLRHRRTSLEEREALEATTTRLGDLETRRAELRARRDNAAREEQRFDDEATSLEERAAEVERKMYSGEIASPRELQSMQADVEQLRRHKRGLEDRELAVMEQRSALDTELGKLDAEAAALGAEAEELRATLARVEAEIDAELGAESAARDELASRLPGDLLDEYERCRARARGVGAARLVGGTCQGCHLSIPATEADRIRKGEAGAIAHCDNCGCILVP